jgi:purine-nucleoside phosphorylase
MYKTYSADDYRKHFGFTPDYTVHGLIVFGTFNKNQYQELKNCIKELGLEAKFAPVARMKENYRDFFEPILEFTLNGKIYWFTIAYGGTLLSEWVHLACLWGSQTNIVVGDCGGLLREANAHDIVVPTFAYANESATRMYEPEANCRHYADEQISRQLMKRLEDKHKIWNGPTVTCQAMLAETREDIERWSSEGYYGVEMESATVFAVSNHFKRKTAAVLGITDNLIQEKTNHDINFEASGDYRQHVRREQLMVALQELLASN